MENEIHFRLDNHEYVLEQNALKFERMVTMLQQYFPDVEIIEIVQDGEVFKYPPTD